MAADLVRVIVVDDDHDSAASLGALLALDGYQLWTAHSGAEALAAIESAKPHCVLLDLLMPEMSGVELAGRIRAQDGPGVVLVATSGVAAGGLMQRQAELAGVDHFLSKPLDMARLRAILPPISEEARSSAVKVLVVDTSRAVRESLRTLLEIEGYDVFTACNGTEALERVHEVEPQCLVFHLHTSDMPAAELARRTLATIDPPTILICMTGSYGFRPAMTAAQEAGVRHFVTKPIQFEKLRALLPDPSHPSPRV